MMRSELISLLLALPEAEVIITWEGTENSIETDNVYVAQGYIVLDADGNHYRDAYISGQRVIEP